VRAAIPNDAHIGLARMEKFFEIQIITQNIDDLHERAGSSKVIHLHGEIFKMRSEKDESLINPILDDIKMGDMASDGMQFRPHIVWFEEPVPLIVDAGRLVNKADFFAIIGTSLAVYPAAGLIDFAPASIPKFIVDKSIPFMRGIKNLNHIQKPATLGIRELEAQLLKHI
jgi:NAD-dependent deacetylase